MKDTKCEYFCRMFSDYLDGEIARAECELLEEHIKICPPCALRYESLKIAVNLCCKGLNAEAPPEVRERLKSFLREHCCKEKV
jgi:hypothetical protein